MKIKMELCVLGKEIKLKIRFPAHKFGQNLKEINQPLYTCLADRRRALTPLDRSKQRWKHLTCNSGLT